MYLDFTTLYSQLSIHYERVLDQNNPPPPEKKNTQKTHKKPNKNKPTTTTIEEVLRAILKSKRRITLLEIIF